MKIRRQHHQFQVQPLVAIVFFGNGADVCCCVRASTCDAAITALSRTPRDQFPRHIVNLLATVTSRTSGQHDFTNTSFTRRVGRCTLVAEIQHI